MLCDIFRQLRPFGRVEDYVYVGFGSVWFEDFSLFHKVLGIKEMISIEHAVASQLRIDENKPFRIRVDYRSSKVALPDLDWSRRQFIWLDYDDPLHPDMLNDANQVALSANSGTVLTLSVQCVRSPSIDEAAKNEDKTNATAAERFVQTFGQSKVPPGVGDDDLRGWPYGDLCRKIIYGEIESALATRNSSQQDTEMLFSPICDFEYMDGAKMTTITGVFYEKSDKEKFEECKFSSLDFIGDQGAPTRIHVPKLTVREFKRLESQLPLGVGQQLVLGTIPEKEAELFHRYYRYLPNFAVVQG